TAGALLLARDIIAPRFVMLNGDYFFDTNLRSLAAAATTAGQEALMALCRVDDASRYGTVDMDGDRVVRLREKDPTRTGPALINAGAHVLTSALIDRIGRLPCSMEVEVFPRLAAAGELFGCVRGGYFLDIERPETLDQGRRELLSRRRRPAAFLDRDGVINTD